MYTYRVVGTDSAFTLRMDLLMHIHETYWYCISSELKKCKMCMSFHMYFRMFNLIHGLFTLYLHLLHYFS